jgi:hypothetical protein
MSEREPRHIGPPLPPELADALRDESYACLTASTDTGTVFVIKAPSHEIRSVRGNVPILLRHELYDTPTAPVIRLALRIYDQPRQPLAMESFINVREPDQREEYAALAEQEHIYLLFYDELLQHRLNQGIHNDDRAVVPQILATAEQLAGAIPDNLYDFDLAKQAIQERYPV